MDFTAIDRNDLPQQTRKSNPETTELFDKFLASGVEIAKIDLGDKKLPSVRSSFNNYVKKNKLPVKVFSRGGDEGDLYLERTAGESVTSDEASDELANA